MEMIALTRIAHVLPFVKEAQGARMQMDLELRQRSLPTVHEQASDGFIPKLPLFECLQAVANRAAIRDFGYRAYRRWRVTSLDGDVLACVRSGRTLAARLNVFANLCRIEDTQLDVSLCAEGASTRIVLSRGQRAFNGFQYSEWMQVAAALGIARDAVAARAQPLELTFQSHYTPSAEVSAEVRHARIVGGAPCTSIVLSTSLLEEPLTGAALSVDASAVMRAEETLKALNSGRVAPRLKLVLRSYLKEGYSPIGLAAALARTSVRSLQRELALSGVSYLELVQTVRFEEASRMLAKDRTKVIDIALSLGYEDASHFSRAFKRTTGISPRQYRTQHAL